MRRKLPYVILSLLVLCLGVAGGYMFLRSHLLSRPELFLEEVVKRADLSLKDIDYTHIVDGKKQWTLKADQVDYLQKDDVYSLRQVRVLYYASPERVVTLQGKEGLFSRSEGWVRVKGEAVITADGGYKAESEEFTYRIQSQEVQSQEEVRLAGPGFAINGRGLTVNLGTWKARLQNDVKSEFRLATGAKNNA